MNRIFLKVIFVLASVFSSTLPLSASNSETSTEESFREVAGELRCPTCTGLSVLDSDAPFSVQIKEEVKNQLSQGKSHDEILKFFMDRYGPWILRAPPVKGVNSLAWIIPIAILFLGPVLIWFFVGRGRIDANEKPVRTTEQILSELKEELANRGIEG